MNRHDLLILNEKAIQIAGISAKSILKSIPGMSFHDMVERSHQRIPAIVRRQQSRRAGMVDVGFSTPRHFEGVRCTFLSMVPESGIEEVIDPFAVLEKAVRTNAMPRQAAMLHAAAAALGAGFRLGLFGSFAMQAMTGMPYATRGSDMDLLLQGDLSRIREVSDRLCEIETIYGIRMDVEVRLDMGYDVKMKELLSPGSTILGKSLTELKLIAFQH